MGIRFSIKTLLIIIALIASVCFIGFKYSRYNRFKDVQERLYMLNCAIDENGVEVEILSNTIPITQVKIEICKAGQYPKAILSEVVKLDSGLEKMILIQKGTLNRTVVETNGTTTVVLLPKHLEGSDYTLSRSHPTGHRRWLPPGLDHKVREFNNDLQELLELNITIQ